MKIIIDLQGNQSTGSRNRGIGRYSLSITKAILKNKKDHQVLIVLSNLFQENIALIKEELQDFIAEKNIYVWDAPLNVSFIDANNDTKRKDAQYLRETFLASLNPDMVFITSLFEGLMDDAVTSIGLMKYNIPTAVVLYDLIPLIHSSPYLDNVDVNRWYREKITHLQKADLLLSISDSSRNEAIKYLNTPCEKVINIGTAADEQFQKIDISAQLQSDVLLRYKLTKDFLMYTGGIDHRKNIEGLIRSYALLSLSIRNEHQLAIVCSINDEQRKTLNTLAKSLGLKEEELIFTGYIKEDDLIVLYNLCKAFIFPSWHEGFGLPALEAMHCGAPVIASDKSSLPEVIGLEDALFDSLNDNKMSQKIEQILTDESFRKRLISHGEKQCEKFSWDQSAKKAIQAFESFIQNQKAPLIQKENMKQKLAYFSPMPPQRSGIADYSLELLSYLSDYYDIDIIVEDMNSIDKDILEKYSLETIDYFEDNVSKYQRKLYHFGNSHFHKYMFDLLAKYQGTVVLHDFYLGHVIDSMGVLDQQMFVSHSYT
ncbi:MAG: glycosyltransferase family 1 protein, partial [Arcobacteraceae bacterium]